jgi:hypothetical protein
MIYLIKPRHGDVQTATLSIALLLGNARVAPFCNERNMTFGKLARDSRQIHPSTTIEL